MNTSCSTGARSLAVREEAVIKSLRLGMFWSVCFYKKLFWRLPQIRSQIIPSLECSQSSLWSLPLATASAGLHCPKTRVSKHFTHPAVARTDGKLQKCCTMRLWDRRLNSQCRQCSHPTRRTCPYLHTASSPFRLEAGVWCLLQHPP